MSLHTNMTGRCIKKLALCSLTEEASGLPLVAGAACGDKKVGAVKLTKGWPEPPFQISQYVIDVNIHTPYVIPSEPVGRQAEMRRISAGIPSTRQRL